MRKNYSHKFANKQWRMLCIKLTTPWSKKVCNYILTTWPLTKRTIFFTTTSAIIVKANSVKEIYYILSKINKIGRIRIDKFVPRPLACNDRYTYSSEHSTTREIPESSTPVKKREKKKLTISFLNWTFNTKIFVQWGQVNNSRCVISE